MAWGGGTYTKPYTWTAGTPILATDHNAQDTDFTNGINNCLAKDGQNAMTGNLSLGGNILTNVGAGSAATPSFSPGADVDTGMFLAGTNALGYATGGVERMRISNAGQVGVGTTAPLDMLDVSSAAGTFRARFRNTTANESVALFQNSTTGTGTTSGLAVGINANSDAFCWQHANTNFVFGTNNAERMRIAANGTVGIGTSTPATALDVVGVATIGSAPDPGFLINLGRGTGFNRHGYITGNGTAIEFNNQQNGALFFSANNAERMRINANGNVGIGTNTPLDQLDVASGQGTFRARFRNTTANEAFALFQNSNSGTGTTDGMAVGINTSGVAFCWNHETADLRFGTNNLERMRITSGGDVIAGPVVSAWTNEGIVLTPTNGAGSSYITVFHSSADVGGNWYASFRRNDVQVGTITSSGTTGVAYNVTSDYRLKENVQPIQGGLERVKNLRPVAYSWKQDGSLGEGFLAHELQEIIPHAVTGAKDEVDANGEAKYQGVDYGKLTTVLTAAIKELTAKVEALEAQVASLAVP